PIYASRKAPRRNRSSRLAPPAPRSRYFLFHTFIDFHTVRTEQRMGRRSNVSRIFFELGTGEKPTESSRQGRVLRLLNSYAPHAWRWYLPAVPTSLVGACAQLAVPAAAALAIDGAARGELGWNLLVMAAALAAAALAQLGGGILIARFHAEATASL